MQSPIQRNGDPDWRWLRRKRRPVLRSIPQRTVRMIDLFSGCGGISMGVQAACLDLNIQLQPVIAWDIFTAATEVYAKNFTGVEIRSEPIETVIDGERGQPPTESERKFMESVGEINLIVGGPPCQGNSNLNNHTRGTDERNLLYLRMARMIEILKPEYAIIENVAGVRRAQQNVVSETKNWLETEGYSTVEGLIDGRNVGVPQMRKRHFSIASRVSALDLLSFQHREGIEERPISWAIEDLLEVYDENDVLNSASKAKERTNLAWITSSRTTCTIFLLSTDPSVIRSTTNTGQAATPTLRCTGECIGIDRPHHHDRLLVQRSRAVHPPEAGTLPHRSGGGQGAILPGFL